MGIHPCEALACSPPTILGVVPRLSKMDPSKDFSRSRRGGTGTSSSAAANGHIVAAAAKPIRYCMMMTMINCIRLRYVQFVQYINKYKYYDFLGWIYQEGCLPSR